jgi:hypothetical protein
MKLIVSATRPASHTEKMKRTWDLSRPASINLRELVFSSSKIRLRRPKALHSLILRTHPFAKCGLCRSNRVRPVGRNLRYADRRRLTRETHQARGFFVLLVVLINALNL